MIKKKIIACLVILNLFSVSCKAQEKFTFVKAPNLTYRNKLPIPMRNCWQHLDIEKDTLAGTSLNRAYSEIIKNKKGKEVIVAVIDTDIDKNHEDLKQAIWINKKETPNNGVDDDKNGYIDDVNGWNFLGNKNGESISFANMGSVRILRYLKKKYESYPNFKGNKSDSLLNVKAMKAYEKDKESIALYRKYASDNILTYKNAEKSVKKHFNKSEFTYSYIDSLYKKNANNEDTELSDNLYYLRYYLRLGKNLQELKKDSIKEDQKLLTTYNDDYYDRIKIGDNENDINDRNYGNNDISRNAKLTFHGTVVSGVIGASRANKIGIDGFSDSIKIMPIIAAPFGGLENDKDIALAIRYAVDNGAKVINMSFGNPLCLHPEWIKNAFLYAEAHDVLLVAGSGNDASDNDIVPFYPVDYDLNSGIEFCNNFIKVGSITTKGNENFLATYTNFGKKTVDLFASGDFIKTTDANVGYSYQDGTSMASPIVCGVAALVRSYYPKLSASQVKQILLDSGVAYDNLKVQVPGEKEGVLRPFSELSKSGKVVNAYNALLMADTINKKSKK
jgi:cell wall-associated protease